MIKLYAVDVYEFESGYGMRFDDTMICKTKEIALDFIEEINDDTYMDDWRMVAVYKGESKSVSEKFMNIMSKDKDWLSNLKKELEVDEIINLMI